MSFIENQYSKSGTFYQYQAAVVFNSEDLKRLMETVALLERSEHGVLPILPGLLFNH